MTKHVSLWKRWRWTVYWSTLASTAFCIILLWRWSSSSDYLWLGYRLRADCLFCFLPECPYVLGKTRGYPCSFLNVCLEFDVSFFWYSHTARRRATRLLKLWGWHTLSDAPRYRGGQGSPPQGHVQRLDVKMRIPSSCCRQLAGWSLAEWISILCWSQSGWPEFCSIQVTVQVTEFCALRLTHRLSSQFFCPLGRLLV